MKTSRIYIAGVVLLVLVGACYIFYPEKTGEVQQSLEAAGAVTVDKIVNALEARVGKTEVALEHYKTVRKAKRTALVELKALQKDCERKINEAKVKAEGLKAAGNTVGAATKEAEIKALEAQRARLTESGARAEKSYKDFELYLENKKLELGALKAKTQMLRSELTLLHGADAGLAMEKARQLEDEVKQTCSRLEAELEVQQMDEDNQ